MSEQEPEFGLVYPFVVCESKGGRYEDQAFVAGAQFGQIDQMMTAHEPVIERYVTSGIVQQLDLAAMHHGYHLTTSEWADDDSWTWISATAEQQSNGDEAT